MAVSGNSAIALARLRFAYLEREGSVAERVIPAPPLSIGEAAVPFVGSPIHLQRSPLAEAGLLADDPDALGPHDEGAVTPDAEARHLDDHATGVPAYALHDIAKPVNSLSISHIEAPLRLAEGRLQARRLEQHTLEQQATRAIQQHAVHQPLNGAGPHAVAAPGGAGAHLPPGPAPPQAESGADGEHPTFPPGQKAPAAPGGAPGPRAIAAPAGRAAPVGRPFPSPRRTADSSPADGPLTFSRQRPSSVLESASSKSKPGSLLTELVVRNKGYMNPFSSYSSFCGRGERSPVVMKIFFPFATFLPQEAPAPGSAPAAATGSDAPAASDAPVAPAATPAVPAAQATPALEGNEYTAAAIAAARRHRHTARSRFHAQRAASSSSATGQRAAPSMVLSIKSGTTIDNAIGYALYEYAEAAVAGRFTPAPLAQVGAYSLRMVDDDELGTVDYGTPVFGKHQTIEADTFGLCEDKAARKKFEEARNSDPDDAGKPLLFRVHLYSTLDIKQTSTVMAQSNWTCKALLRQLCEKHKLPIALYTLRAADAVTELPPDQKLSMIPDNEREVCLMKKGGNSAGDIYVRPANENHPHDDQLAALVSAANASSLLSANMLSAYRTYGLLRVSAPSALAMFLHSEDGATTRSINQALGALAPIPTIGALAATPLALLVPMQVASLVGAPGALTTPTVAGFSSPVLSPDSVTVVLPPGAGVNGAPVAGPGSGGYSAPGGAPAAGPSLMVTLPTGTTGPSPGNPAGSSGSKSSALRVANSAAKRIFGALSPSSSSSQQALPNLYNFIASLAILAESLWASAAPTGDTGAGHPPPPQPIIGACFSGPAPISARHGPLGGAAGAGVGGAGAGAGLPSSAAPYFLDRLPQGTYIASPVSGVRFPASICNDRGNPMVGDRSPAERWTLTIDGLRFILSPEDPHSPKVALSPEHLIACFLLRPGHICMIVRQSPPLRAADQGPLESLPTPAHHPSGRGSVSLPASAALTSEPSLLDYSHVLSPQASPFEHLPLSLQRQLLLPHHHHSLHLPYHTVLPSADSLLPLRLYESSLLLSDESPPAGLSVDIYTGLLDASIGLELTSSVRLSSRSATLSAYLSQFYLERFLSRRTLAMSMSGPALPYVRPGAATSTTTTATGQPASADGDSQLANSRSSSSSTSLSSTSSSSVSSLLSTQDSPGQPPSASRPGASPASGAGQIAAPGASSSSSTSTSSSSSATQPPPVASLGPGPASGYFLSSQPPAHAADADSLAVCGSELYRHRSFDLPFYFYGNLPSLQQEGGLHPIFGGIPRKCLLGYGSRWGGEESFPQATALLGPVAVPVVSPGPQAAAPASGLFSVFSSSSRSVSGSPGIGPAAGLAFAAGLSSSVGAPPAPGAMAEPSLAGGNPLPAAGPGADAHLSHHHGVHSRYPGGASSLSPDDQVVFLQTDPAEADYIVRHLRFIVDSYFRSAV
ncbi:hypothetical protein H696_03994 [Fonticula alba]|uniref:CRIM domain-containing protein n=1 Tax=Fonticula alba TaxID=691883 RepID=A0A058Z7T3_FONAL|nr:hypothetical protein H696_03994 [Fonticula alba]KCV69572.1 hypothetical protein H696_03994 [Fonticula alba]|eukprot:XP_009496137.1 hypothetical protein H696_03994 [Fonticula alba]